MVCLIANQLARDGHEVRVIYSIRPDTPSDLREMFDERVQLVHVQMKGRGTLNAISRLRKQLVSFAPDVVHLHSSFAGFLGRLAMIGLRAHAACLYSPHCISFMRRDIPVWKKYVYVLLERIGCIKPTLYIACSESEAAEIVSHLRQPTKVIENAVDTRNLRTTSVSGASRGGQRTIVSVGGIRRQKNPNLFAEIAHRLAGHDFQFVWIGDGDAQYKDALRAADVEVTGWMSREDVVERVRQCGIYLSTSSWEGMPVSVIEAMLVGKPVVVSSCAGNIDVVRHMHNGAVYNNASEAADLIGKIVENKGLYDHMSDNAAMEARARFSEERFLSELLAIYRGAIRG
ncbi:glycosyltransferase family 4 protein [Paraburkholderia sp. J7]|uniref:glycosyltransferase family 4 protein n=1 Tax=Paraburkholderia sp. J7 TaxID=2805438 RepID=UPI002AB72E50|nr:glycosyltransferase family 4 protein [Paraburkholderia sp. J7]